MKYIHAMILAGALYASSVQAVLVPVLAASFGPVLLAAAADNMSKKSEVKSIRRELKKEKSASSFKEWVLNHTVGKIVQSFWPTPQLERAVLASVDEPVDQPTDVQHELESFNEWYEALTPQEQADLDSILQNVIEALSHAE